MAKKQSTFECVECGFQSLKYFGKCPRCNAWNSLVESLPDSQEHLSPKAAVPAQPLDQVDSREVIRQFTNISELDRVLGGGIVPGSIILIGGEPGVGKSTLLLEISGRLAKKNQSVLYYSGEESGSQIKLRADRLDIPGKGIDLLSMGSLEDLTAAIETRKPGFVIVDSIQTLTPAENGSGSGSAGVMRKVTAQLIDVAKKTNITVFIIGHINKDGQIAGPKTLEHMVDVVLYFQGEMKSDLRILRAEKNRFGPVNELGIFEMTARGLESVKDPAGLFVHSRNVREPGVAIFPAMNGLRSILVEVQALVTESPFAGNPRRMALGFDSFRMAMLIALIEKKLKIPFYQHDVFLNVTGGAALRDPAGDLSALAALLSSRQNMQIPGDIIMIGEIGLTGEIRNSAFLETRLKESVQHGMNRFILPESRTGAHIGHAEKLTVKYVSNLFGFYQALRQWKNND